MKWVGIVGVGLLSACLSGKAFYDQSTQLNIRNGLERYEQELAERIANGEEWNLRLINRWHRLPDDFEVELTKLSNGHIVDKRIAEDLNAMLAAARKENLYPVICSSYRSKATQEYLYKKRVARARNEGYTDAKLEAAGWVAVPRSSEHEAGLALDIVSSGYQGLDRQQENTKEQKWLMENSYKYGFILRYPEDKKEITGINYEPWHYRYVGKKAAREIYTLGICLEEYLELFDETYTNEMITW